jgi:hypothetical protein
MPLFLCFVLTRHPLFALVALLLSCRAHATDLLESLLI